MQKNIILVQPASLNGSDHHIRERYSYPPMGLLNIAGVLKMHGYQTSILDFFREDYSTRQKFIDKLKSISPEPLAVGIGTYTVSIEEAYKIAKVVKSIFPKTKIIFGGVHVTFCYHEVIKNEYVDFAIRNEGESSIIELLEHIKHPVEYPAQNIHGISFVDKSGKTVNTPSRPYLQNLDTLPIPPYDLLSFPRGRKGKNSFIFMTSRGCPGDCVFCASRAMSGKRYRFHSAEWLISMVYYYYKLHGFYQMGVMDDTFLVSKKRLLKFCKYLKQCKIDVAWSCKSRVDTIKEDTMKVLKDSRCTAIHIGIESGDADVLEAIDKKISLDKIFTALKLLKKYDIRPECSFILGHHCDTLESIEKTIILAKAIRDNNIGYAIFGISTPFPGTPIYNCADTFGLKFITKQWSKFDLNTPIYYTDNFSTSDIKKAQYHFDVESKYSERGFDLSGKNLSDFKGQISQFVTDVKAIVNEVTVQ